MNLRLTDDRDLFADQKVLLEDQLAEMVALREEVKIAGVGISTATRAQVQWLLLRSRDRAGHHPGRHRLRAERLQPGRPERRRRTGPVPHIRRRLRSVLPAGVRVPGHCQGHRERRRVCAVAERIGASPAQVGLALLLAHRDNVLLIPPGTSSLAHLEENMNIAAIILTTDDIAELETDT